MFENLWWTLILTKLTNLWWTGHWGCPGKVLIKMKIIWKKLWWTGDWGHGWQPGGGLVEVGEAARASHRKISKCPGWRDVYHYIDHCCWSFWPIPVAQKACKYTKNCLISDFYSSCQKTKPTTKMHWSSHFSFRSFPDASFDRPTDCRRPSGHVGFQIKQVDCLQLDILAPQI